MHYINIYVYILDRKKILNLEPQLPLRDCYSFATFIFFDKNLQYFSVKLSENMKASSFKRMQKVGCYTLYVNIVLNNKIWFVCVLELVDILRKI